jgi:RNA:NAD 2'-phosphotransferase (TPT1/KptA family)
VNPEKTKYMLKPSDKKAGQGHSIKIANRSFEGVAKFKHVGTNLRDPNCMHEGIKSTLNS